MNEQKLIQNVIEQIKEAQLKLGAEKEVIRLYFPIASMNAILGTHYTDEQEMLTALRTNTVFDTTVLGRLKFFIHEGRFEVRVPAEGAEYVAGEIPDPPFLKAIVELFAHHHSLTIEEICAWQRVRILIMRFILTMRNMMLIIIASRWKWDIPFIIDLQKKIIRCW